MSWEANIGWLAGILDGEGSIAFSRRGGANLQPYVWVKSTCPFMIERISNIFSAMKVKFTYTTEEYENENWKPAIKIRIGGVDGIEAVLKTCLPYLTTKRDEANAMLSYISWRKTLPKHTSNSNHREAIFTMQELTMMELQDLKRRRMNLKKLDMKPSTPLRVVDGGQHG